EGPFRLSRSERLANVHCAAAIASPHSPTDVTRGSASRPARGFLRIHATLPTSASARRSRLRTHAGPKGIVMRSSARIATCVALPPPAAATAMAVPPAPTYGTANVDGNTGEWDLVNDFFSLMYRAGDPSKPVESRAYLRYDCSTQTMYV